jgi:hypothetical protein
MLKNKVQAPIIRYTHSNVHSKYTLIILPCNSWNNSLALRLRSANTYFLSEVNEWGRRYQN